MAAAGSGATGASNSWKLCLHVVFRMLCACVFKSECSFQSLLLCSSCAHAHLQGKGLLQSWVPGCGDGALCSWDVLTCASMGLTIEPPSAGGVENSSGSVCVYGSEGRMPAGLALCLAGHPGNALCHTLQIIVKSIFSLIFFFLPLQITLAKANRMKN